MHLPLTIDLTPKGKIVHRASFGTKDYIDNIEYTLQIHFVTDYIHIDYYGEDGTLLSDVCEDFIEQIRALD